MAFTPLKLHPCYKDYLWGGTRLKREYNMGDAPEITAESWVLSCHSAGFSVVESGSLSGKTLLDLAEADRLGYWGSNCIRGQFPILVKLIDAAENLSIQVHPSDENCIPSFGEQGKAELWYVVDSKPKSVIFYGFSKQIGPEEFRRRSEDGSITQVLNCMKVKKGDVFYILPGTVHAIGAGTLIAEIQQNSDTTFRIYDYLRRDTSGNLRPLHLDRAVQTVDYAPLLPEECQVNCSMYTPAFSMAELFSCKYFRTYRLRIHQAARLACDGTSFHHILFVKGSGTIRHNSICYPFQKGDSFFIPAALGEYQIHGACHALLSHA